ncbi:MAG: saccharopine dehydrogenase NADP-binding domain-containing protein [Trueperaceae bacterium]|nr:saccharopine dehydrogenase NADP-binding domain-containing protein [Trueperaceae bacterium]
MSDAAHAPTGPHDPSTPPDRTAPHDRDLDLVVWGATGFTGRLVADAVARRAPADLRWTVGGRDAAKLAAVVADLPEGTPAPQAPIVADARDADAMRALATRTRAVVSTVGPYARYGTPLVDAAADAGTDYADLTAEVPWMRRNVDVLHARAGASGARLVHASGFDSVPSDLGVWALQRAALARHGRACREVVHLVGPAAGGVSGGTIQSGLDLLAGSAADPAHRAALRDPDVLAPGGTPSRDPLGPLTPLRHPEVGAWSAPFVMAAANAKVVRRTRFLAGEPWGDVRYLERFAAPTWARAMAVGAATGGAAATLAWGPARRAAARLLPAPGEGPSARTRAGGFFRTTLIGVCPPEGGAPAAEVRAHVAANLDPGYDATARMLAEMGLLFAAGASDAAGGVTTPASVGGDAYLARLAAVGVRVTVADPRSPAPT